MRSPRPPHRAVVVVFAAVAACSSHSRKTDVERNAGASTTTAATAATPVPAEAPEASARSAPLVDGAKAPVEPCPPGMAAVAGGRLSTLERGRDVEVQGFCIDVTEVTVRAFREAVEAGRVARDCAAAGGASTTRPAAFARGDGSPAACPAVPRRTEWNDVDEDAISSRFCNGAITGRDDHPVNCVSFDEAARFCAARGARLPTGDEWEWAARGKRPSPWGTIVATDQICWGKPHKRGGTCPSGATTTDITDDGVADLGGNLTEWVLAPNRYEGAHARFAYGASWYAVDDGYARAALGGVEMPARRAETVGFRCAASLR